MHLCGDNGLLQLQNRIVGELPRLLHLVVFDVSHLCECACECAHGERARAGAHGGTRTQHFHTGSSGFTSNGPAIALDAKMKAFICPAV